MSDCCSSSKGPLVWIIVGAVLAAAIGFAVFGGRWTDSHHGDHGMDGGHDMTPMGGR